MSYQTVYQEWQNDPNRFWAKAAEDIQWTRPWTNVCDPTSRPSGVWFSGGALNTCQNALDRHVENGRGDNTALIYHSAMIDEVRRFTYRELRDEVSVFAGALARSGVTRGDRIAIYMPMVPEAVVAMLACARIGAIHTVVFGGFAAKELAARLDDFCPKLVLFASCGLEPQRIVDYSALVESALALAEHEPQGCVVFQRPQKTHRIVQGRDIEWTEFTKDAPVAECVPVEATDPLYVLYTSGTTGKPKGIVRDNGGHAVALHWSMEAIYGIRPGDVFWAASDIGWVVGHSYIVYGPLLAGATSVLYEGKPVGTPDAGAFWEVIAQHDVDVLFTAPTAIRAIKREDPHGALLKDHDLSKFRALFLAGERCDPDTLKWAETHLSVPVLDHWWQTETGWAIAGNPLGLGLLEVRPGSAGMAMPGWAVAVLDRNGDEVPARESGSIVCKLPLPPGSFSGLWNAPEKFVETYFAAYEGYYLTGDAGYRDDDGYIFVMTREDDIINVAGHRLSTGAIEEVLASHDDVAECAVAGIHDDLKGQVPMGFACLKAGADRDHETINQELVALVREKIGPVAAFKRVLIVPRLPKTRSGKILRRSLSRLANGEHVEAPATIDDPAILDEVKSLLATAVGKSV